MKCWTERILVLSDASAVDGCLRFPLRGGKRVVMEEEHAPPNRRRGVRYKRYLLNENEEVPGSTARGLEERSRDPALKRNCRGAPSNGAYQDPEHDQLLLPNELFEVNFSVDTHGNLFMSCASGEAGSSVPNNTLNESDRTFSSHDMHGNRDGNLLVFCDSDQPGSSRPYRYPDKFDKEVSSQANMPNLNEHHDSDPDDDPDSSDHDSSGGHDSVSDTDSDQNSSDNDSSDHDSDPDSSHNSGDDGSAHDGSIPGNDQPANSHQKLRRLLPTLQEPITSHADVTFGEALLMALAVSLQNRTTFKAFTDIVKFANALFPMPILPKSAYLLDQYLNSEDVFQRHFYCNECMYAFGVQDYKLTKSLKCPNCNTVSKILDLTKATYFVQYNLICQLQLLLEEKSVRDNLKDPKSLLNTPEPTVIKDIYDGKSYRKFVFALDPNDRHMSISLSMCADGTPLFNSSNLSIWPCFLSVNELPPALRMGNLLLGGLWFGKRKPPMDLFFGPIVQHIISLSNPGFELSFENNIVPMKAYAIALCVDAAARGPIQCLNLYSGYFSCNWCEHPGEYIDNAVRFPCQAVLPRVRTHQSVIQAGRQCLDNPEYDYVKGVRGISPLSKLPLFDMVEGFVQDFAHNVPFGIARVFLTEWISNPNRAYYIGSPVDIRELDSKIDNLTPPIEVRRMPRNIAECKHWKMREFENWILLFSTPVLSGVMSKTFLDHWLLLVQACYLLSLEEASTDQIDLAHMLLVQFVHGVEKLYGPNYMSYNVHILSHLAENVSRWAPVQYISTYAYETGNADIKDAIHAFRGIPHQIQRYLSQKQAFQILKHHCSSARTKEFIENILSKPKTKNVLRVGDSVLHGTPRKFLPSEEELFLLNQICVGVDSQQCDVFEKVVHKKCVFTSLIMSRKRINDNSVAIKLNSGDIVRIHKIIFVKPSDEIFVFCVMLRCETFLSFGHIQVPASDHFMYTVSHESARLRLIPLSDLKSVCCITVLNGNCYVSMMPNILNVF